MKTIAISGKGGTGKSTIAALMVRWLSRHKPGSVLAVDADSNVNLNVLLGLEIKDTVGAIREEMKKKQSSQNLPGGMSKARFLEYKIQSSLVETPAYDLIAMGRPEGPGCYCYANNLLREILQTLSSQYAYVIIDNEAGMEHLSRRTTLNIDSLLIISDATVRGVRTAANISRLLSDLDIKIGEKRLIVNRLHGEVSPVLTQTLKEEHLELGLTIPDDKNILDMENKGESIWTLPDSSPIFLAVDKWMNNNIHFQLEDNTHVI
ncbi:AAA family ATPase [Acidobacteriota bacterium]